MAFNVNDYVKDSAKSPVDRIIDTVVRSSSNGKSNNAKSIAESTAKTFFDIASSYESVSAFSASRTDNIISGAADEFYALAGKNSDRTIKVDLNRLRRISSEDTNSYLNTVNPATKIGAVKKNNTIEILSVL